LVLRVWGAKGNCPRQQWLGRGEAVCSKTNTNTSEESLRQSKVLSCGTWLGALPEGLLILWQSSRPGSQRGTHECPYSPVALLATGGKGLCLCGGLSPTWWYLRTTRRERGLIHPPPVVSPTTGEVLSRERTRERKLADVCLPAGRRGGRICHVLQRRRLLYGVRHRVATAATLQS